MLIKRSDGKVLNLLAAISLEPADNENELIAQFPGNEIIYVKFNLNSYFNFVDNDFKYREYEWETKDEKVASLSAYHHAQDVTPSIC